ncbi:alpha-2,8-sialyltransferase 8E-like isoform X2 [Ptychodera flava]|uniref:alpha-2,8-sialyltransferase 8E-like isoform X2 n=1 Tax=Ptychodera flava TaxID=63121 RepID=UPI00396A596C
MAKFRFTGHLACCNVLNRSTNVLKLFLLGMVFLNLTFWTLFLISSHTRLLVHIKRDACTKKPSFVSNAQAAVPDEESETDETFDISTIYQSINPIWEFNATAADELRTLLDKECNTEGTFITTKESAKIDDSFLYHGHQKLKIKITPEIYRRFPKKLNYKKKQYKTCSIVGNSGILLGSRCGKQIDSADFVARFNNARIRRYALDTGVKTDFITCNPSILTLNYYGLADNSTARFQRDMLNEYGNATVFFPAFACRLCTPLAFKAQDVLESTDMETVFGHPHHAASARAFWEKRGVNVVSLSSGLLLFTGLFHFCEEVHLYGYWPFPEDPYGKSLHFHYYDRKMTMRTDKKHGIDVHNMPSEFKWLVEFHNQGILRLHVGARDCFP